MADNKNVFNPVKEDIDGKIAKRMIWSTESINLALKGLEQGRKLVANPFYENNTKLLKGDLVFQRTPEEIEDFKKCMGDIIFFANKRCQLMTPEGIQHITLRDYQEKYLKHLEANRLSIYLACRQCSKCVSLISEVCCKISDQLLNNIDDRLKKELKKNYYISKDDTYVIPLFELYNLCDKRIIWKIKYHLYKLIYSLICLKVKHQKKKLGNV